MSSSTATLTISYVLHPPPSSSSPADLHPEKTHNFPLELNPASSEGEIDGNSEAYYVALRDAIARAKEITGQELTEWRDAVGDKEKDKTGGKFVGEEPEEEDDDDDEELEPEQKDKESNK